MRDAFIARRDYILNDVFGERLPFLDDNPPILENLSSLEKLTSRTTRRSPHGTVQLEHLQVVEGGISSVTARVAIFSRPSLGTLPSPGLR